MKIKTADLTGPALRYAIGMAEGLKFEWDGGAGWLYPAEYTGYMRAVCDRKALSVHSGLWTDDWAQGGPILDREGVAFTVNHDERCPIDLKFTAFMKNLGTGRQGPTHLIAAMRCFVASRLGDEVDVPEELCHG